MRLVHTETGLDLLLEEAKPSIVTIEKIERYSEVIGELLRQFDGVGTNFILSEFGKVLPLSKTASLVMNPFTVSCNELKILKKVYAELTEDALHTFSEQTAQINAQLIEYLDTLVDSQHYPLKYDLEIDISGLLKLVGVKLDEIDTSILDRFLNYIKLSHRILGIRLFIFVGIKNFFSTEQLLNLYHELLNEQVFVLDFESHYVERLTNENHTIIDKDWCFIQL